MDSYDLINFRRRNLGAFFTSFSISRATYFSGTVFKPIKGLIDRVSLKVSKNDWLVLYILTKSSGGRIF